MSLSSDDSYDDEDWDSDYSNPLSEDDVSSDASYVAEDLDEKEITLQRSYITRRNAKILKGEEHFFCRL